MQEIRCQCGKIVCQVDHIPEICLGDGPAESKTLPSVVILCRHCKRYVVLHIPGSAAVYHNGSVHPGKLFLSATL